MEGSVVKAVSTEGRFAAPRAATAIAVATVIVALSMAGGGYSGLAVGSATVTVWLLVLGVLLTGRGRPTARPAFATATLGLAALLGFTALSLGWASDDGAGFADAVRLAGYLGTFLLVGLIVPRGGGARALEGIALGVVVVSVIALASRLAGLGDGDADLVALLPAAGGRLSYPVGYWNALGALMALAVPLLVWIGTEARSPWLRTTAIAAMPLPLLAAYMTGSRGALLAAALGAAAFIPFAADRWRAGAALALGVAAALPAIVAATVEDGILDGYGSGDPGRPELVVVLLLLAGSATLLARGGRWVARASRRGATLFDPSRESGRGRLGIPLLAILATGLGLLLFAGPGGLIDDLRAPPEQEGRAEGGIFTASGSGRAQFWGTALEAFADAPVKGIGAGGYASYWNRAGSIETPVRNAHSEPLELLAELGLAGLACFLTFTGAAFVAGLRAARGAGGSRAGAAVGLMVAGSVGFLIDWTWQVPAVVVPFLIAAALVTGGALEPDGTRHAPPRRLAWVVAAGSSIVVAVAALWAGGVLAIASAQLTAGGEALERGELSEAAQSVRAAIAVEPWASEPWVRLAEVERAAGNLEAAQRDMEAAIERAPDDFRPWLLSSVIQAELGNRGATIAYALRAKTLAPLVLRRAALALYTGPGSGA